MQNISLHEELVEEYDDTAPQAGEYGDTEYWDRNFATDLHPVEWYDDYEAFKPFLDPVFQACFKEYDEEEDDGSSDIIVRDGIEYVWDYRKQVLVAGVGNSFFCEDMHEDGIRNMTAFDISRVLIHQMKDKYNSYDNYSHLYAGKEEDETEGGNSADDEETVQSILDKIKEDAFSDVSPSEARRMRESERMENGDELPSTQWLQGNICYTSFEDRTFDVIIEKGLFDCVVCSDFPKKKANDMINELMRILKPNGTYVCISHAAPDERLPFLYCDDIEEKDYRTWSVDVNFIAKRSVAEISGSKRGSLDIKSNFDLDKMYFVYTCKSAYDRVLLLKAKRDKEERERNKKRLKKGKNVA